MHAINNVQNKAIIIVVISLFKPVNAVKGEINTVILNEYVLLLKELYKLSFRETGFHYSRYSFSF